MASVEITGQGSTDIKDHEIHAGALFIKSGTKEAVIVRNGRNGDRSFLAVCLSTGSSSHHNWQTRIGLKDYLQKHKYRVLYEDETIVLRQGA